MKSNFNLKKKLSVEMTSGCTALFVLKFKNDIYVANSGDCSGVLARKNYKEYINITKEHKPNL